jgi:hypothetical protein
VVEWFLRNGGKLKKADVRDTVKEGRGLFATADIAAGETVVSLPAALELRADACLSNSQSTLQQLPSKVVGNLRQGHVLVALCVMELRKLADRDPQWGTGGVTDHAPYLGSLFRAGAEPLPLELAVKGDLNTTYRGSQLLREVTLKKKEVTRLYEELNQWLVKPTVSDLGSLDEFVQAYTVVESHSHAEVAAVSVEPCMLPVIDLLNHNSVSPNVELAGGGKGATSLEVKALKPVPKGTELYLSYLAHHDQRRSSFFWQFGFDDTALPTEVKLGFPLKISDPAYDRKKIRFPQHMVDAKKMYADLAYLLPADKKADLPKALEFPQYLELSCGSDRQAKEHGHVVQYLRFVVATDEELDGMSAAVCPGEPPACPNEVSPANEYRATQRLATELLAYRAAYSDFASDRAGVAAKLLDDERACMDSYLMQAGAPQSPVVGLGSLGLAVLALSMLFVWKSQRAIWTKGRRHD